MPAHKKQKIEIICKICNKGKFFIPSTAKNRKFCSRKCSTIFGAKILSDWLKDPINKLELSRRNKISGKIGYKAILRWRKENPKKFLKILRMNGKKSIRIRKNRGTFYEEMVRAGKVGSHENKVKAGKINAEKNLKLLRENAKKYGVRGGKRFLFKNYLFRSKGEIKIYKMLKKRKINFIPLFVENGKEFDFVFPERKIVIEYHPINPLFEKRTIEKYLDDRKKDIIGTTLENYEMLTFTKINQIRNYIDGVV